MHSVQAVELVILLLLLFVVAFGALARRLQVPYPIILVIAGALLGLSRYVWRRSIGSYMSASS